MNQKTHKNVFVELCHAISYLAPGTKKQLEVKCWLNSNFLIFSNYNYKQFFFNILSYNTDCLNLLPRYDESNEKANRNATIIAISTAIFHSNTTQLKTLVAQGVLKFLSELIQHRIMDDKIISSEIIKQMIDDGHFMQTVLAPIVRSQTKRMINNHVFKKIKQECKNTDEWPILYCSKRMRRQYFLS